MHTWVSTPRMQVYDRACSTVDQVQYLIGVSRPA